MLLLLKDAAFAFHFGARWLKQERLGSLASNPIAGIKPTLRGYFWQTSNFRTVRVQSLRNSTLNSSIGKMGFESL